MTSIDRKQHPPSTESKDFRLEGERKKPHPKMGLFQDYAGDHLISHTLSRAVPSAQRGLTSVFGMGTGVTLAVNSPANCRSRSRDASQLNRLSLLDNYRACVENPQNSE